MGSFSQDVAVNTISPDALQNCSSNGETSDTLSNNKRVVFKLNPGVDIPVTIGTAAWSVFTMTKIYNKGGSTEAQILSLNKDDINPLDRWAIRPYNGSLDKTSYIPFYASISLPMAFFLTGNDMRSDYLELTFLYFETLSITGFAGFSAVYFDNKYRPYTYSAGTSMSERMGEGAKNSFYAGHVEVVATSTFFLSQVYASYYPDSKIKWLFYGLSGVATAGMGYMRLNAGDHFPSDILVGAAAGTLSGLLVPYFHNHKIIKSKSISLSPLSNGSANGLSMVYKFNK
jgi:membrane-associated phospholipid phosphatase